MRRQLMKVCLISSVAVESNFFIAFWKDWEATDNFHPEETDEAKDYEKNQFLDLRRPLLRQVWEANFRFVL